MKVFICIVIILSLLLCGFTVNYFYLKNKSDLIIKYLDEIEKYALLKDDKNLEKSFLELEKLWLKSKNIMFTFSNHKDIECIYESILKMKVRILKKDYFGVIEEAKIAKYIANETPMKEIPAPYNIF